MPWLGANFAAVWAALYARFASQWQYLAGVRNQLRQTLVSLDKDLKKLDKENANQLCLWRAEFVQDAIDLHLATKTMFGPFLKRTLNDTGVRNTFDKYTFDGARRRDRLEKQLEKRFPDPDSQRAAT